MTIIQEFTEGFTRSRRNYIPAETKTPMKPLLPIILDNKKKFRMLMDTLIEQASKSPLSFQHGACIIKNNKILSVGYNHYLTKKKGEKYTVHAEESAILNLRYKDRLNTSEYTLVVIRIGKDNEMRLSKPCLKCSNMIDKFCFKNVYYSC